jgi:hypothetical protein
MFWLRTKDGQTEVKGRKKGRNITSSGTGVLPTHYIWRDGRIPDSLHPAGREYCQRIASSGTGVLPTHYIQRDRSIARHITTSGMGVLPTRQTPQTNDGLERPMQQVRSAIPQSRQSRWRPSPGNLKQQQNVLTSNNSSTEPSPLEW